MTEEEYLQHLRNTIPDGSVNLSPSEPAPQPPNISADAALPQETYATSEEYLQHLKDTVPDGSVNLNASVIPQELPLGEEQPAVEDGLTVGKFFDNVLKLPEIPTQLASAISEATVSDKTFGDALLATADYVAGVGKAPLETNFENALKVANTEGERTALATAATASIFGYVPMLAPLKGVAVALKAPQIAKRAMVASGMHTALEKAGKPLKAAAELGKAIGGQSVQRLRDIATPTASTLANLVEGKSGGITGIDQAIWLKTGDTLPKLEDAVKAYAKKVAAPRPAGVVTRIKDVTRLVPAEASAMLQAEIKSGQMSKEAKAVSDILKKHGDYLVKNGTIERTIDNWLMDRWDAKMLATQEGGAKFIDMVLRSSDYTVHEAKDILKNIVERDGLDLPMGQRAGEKFTLSPQGELLRATGVELSKDDHMLLASLRTDLAKMKKENNPAYADSLKTYRSWVDELHAAGKDVSVIGKHGSTMSRVLSIPYQEKAWALQQDADLWDTLSAYVHQTTRYAEFNKRFGLDYSNANKLIEQIQREKKALGTTLAQHELDKIYGSLDALVGMYKPLADTVGDKLVGGMNSVLVPAMYVLTLPLATISSLSEVVMPLGRAALRPSAVLKGMPALIGHVTHAVPRALGLKTVSKHDATRAVEEIGLGLDKGIVGMLGDIHNNTGQTVSNVFFKANFLQQWTKAMMVTSNAIGKAMIEGHLKDILAGKGSVAAYKDDLERLGVSWEQGVEWIKQGSRKDVPFYEKVKMGGLNFVTDTSVIPRSTITPHFASNPRVKLLMQLKSFPIAFGNTVLHNFVMRAAHGTAKERTVIGTTVAMATTLGMLSTAITDEIRYAGDNPRRKGWEPADYLLNGFERFGGLGMFGFAKDAFNSSEYGSDFTTAVAGPSVSYASGTLKAVYRSYNTQEKEGWTKPLATQMARLTPFGNITKSERTFLAGVYRELLGSDEGEGGAVR